MSESGTRAGMSEPRLTKGRGAGRQRRSPVFHALIALTLAAPLPLGAYADWAWASVAAVW